MDLELNEKVVVVTGGAKGIGAATVRMIAEEGGVPVIVDRDAEAGKQLGEELKAGGAQFLVIEADLCSVSDCARAVERTAQEFGRIDALVNNAGVNDRVGLELGDPDRFLASLKLNLLHYYCMAHFALQHLKGSQGSIVNVASKTAVTGQGGTSGYAGSKGAILALTREWAVELASYGIRVNAVVPGEVMTPMYRQWLATFPNPEEKRQRMVSKIPLGQRMTTPEEIAAVIVFLLSAKSGHTTGQYIFPDGGYVHLDRSLT